jgi:N-acetyl-gamma-glutamylphosphate reductase
VLINLYGTIESDIGLPSGAAVKIVEKSDYPKSGDVRIGVMMKKEETFTISLRIPSWSAHNTVEINGEKIFENQGIVANPNCSTVQTVMALYPLQKAFGLKRVVVSTYQAVSGSGKLALEQLRAERAGQNPLEKVYPTPFSTTAFLILAASSKTAIRTRR